MEKTLNDFLCIIHQDGGHYLEKNGVEKTFNAALEIHYKQREAFELLNNKQANLIIIRGLPGSGKSTLAKNIYPNFINVEADMYFIDEYGNYKFDSTRIKQAHEWCYKTTLEMLRQKRNVVVSNTFTQLWEMEPYLNLKNYFNNLLIKVIKITTQYQSIHNIPDIVFDKMKERWENYDGEIII